MNPDRRPKDANVWVEELAALRAGANGIHADRTGTTPDAPLVTEETRWRSARAGTLRLLVRGAYGTLALILVALALLVYVRRSGSEKQPEGPGSGNISPEPVTAFSAIPDQFGQFNPFGARKVTPYKFPVDGELPPELRTNLGGTVTVGKLAVTPEKVECRRLRIQTDRFDRTKVVEQTVREALVLTLTITNTSDLTFHPMDPAFTQRANEGKKDFPITRVVVDRKQFFAGGYLDWPDDYIKFGRKTEVQQANDAVPLGPGQSREYIVFTNPDDTKVIEQVNAAKEVQWRVQVRRDPMETSNGNVSVTAVIGVDFNPTEVKALSEP